MERLNSYALDEALIAVHEWVNRAPGWFHVREISSDKDYQDIYISKLETLVKCHIVERHKSKRGVYRLVDKELEEMDLVNAIAEPVQLWLPFELDDLVEIYPGNMILIAGMKSSGKTAIMLNMAFENQNSWDVSYFNSEMGANEMRKRLDLFPYMTIDQWKFKAYRRSDNFGDVIEGGEGKLW